MHKQRIWELDALRGLCILCVILIHFIFDLQYFLGKDIHLPGIYRFIQDNGGILFILLSGICATLGSRSVRRGIIVFSCGMLITLVTVGMVRLGMADSDIVISFGILHMLGISMVLYALVKRLPTWAIAILGILIIVTGYYFLSLRVSFSWVFFLGLRTSMYSAGDYFPLLPHFGWFCIGVVLGRTLYSGKKSLLPDAPSSAAPLRMLQFCGRHSLWIYLLHQPVCYALVMLITLL